MIYIQSNSERTMPHHFDCAAALYGAIDNCQDWRLTSYEEVSSGKFDLLIRNKLFVGSTEFMTEVFKRVGISDVRVPRNSNRDVEFITLGEAHNRVANGSKLFVKPIEIKLFTGLILDGMKYSSLEKLDPQTMVMAYKPFESKILSEWRIYIHRNQMVDSRNYSGDFTINPDYNYVKSVISQNNDFPCAYTIDVGILESGENVVVEFNDMWAIGNYGMPNDIYLRLLKDRYFEIIRQ